MKKSYLFILSIGFLVSCSEPVKVDEIEQEQSSFVDLEIKHSSEIEWQALNPARGDQSPKAGTIWGDRKGNEPTAFLAKFVDGFSSPPHIHNVSYRAIVIDGLIHNDDPEAKEMWMSKGSFWTQPAGEAHITSAQGENVIAYVEIDESPYLVKPIEEAFDNGEKPVNVEWSNLVWIDGSRSNLIKLPTVEASQSKVKVSFLWQKNNLEGELVRIAKGTEIEIESTEKGFQAVVIAGAPILNSKEINPGSSFKSTGKSRFIILSSKEEESMIYFRSSIH